MEYIIATYRSRNVTYKAYEFMSSNGIVATIVSTPQKANVGCGLSVKFSRADFDKVSQYLASQETFAGFFAVRQTFGGTMVVRI